MFDRSPGAPDHQTFLLALSDRLRSFSEPLAVMYAALEMVGQHLGVNRVGYCEIEDVTGTLYYPVGWGDGVLEPLSGRLPMLQLLGAEYVAYFRQGRTAYVPDVDLDPMVVPGSFASIGTKAFLAVPLVRGGVWVAGLFINQAKVRDWTPEEGALLEGTLVRTWEAVERARAEFALQTMLTRQRDVFSLTRQLIGVTDLDGILLDANPAALGAIGAGLTDVVGRPFWETPWFTGTPGMSDIVRGAVDAARNGQSVRTEMTLILPDGSTRIYDFTMHPMRDAEGRITEIMPEASDITELRKAEEALRQSQKMEAVGQLTGGLAHDFNNLLAGISGALELMQTRMDQGRLTDLDRYMTVAQGAAKRAAALTHRLLAFSRRQTLDPKPTNVNRLISGVEEFIRRTIGPEIAMEVVGAAGLWPTSIDPSQLENALLNLCINARDAMPDGGRITIETANKWLDRPTAKAREIPEGQYLSVCVTDTGTGMTPETVARVFEPFFTTKPIGQGTGLGLSMIYGFARQSGGQVRIYSELGQGTTVCLYLPRYYGDADPDDVVLRLTKVERAGQDETVLIVDDEPSVRMLVTEVLEDLGYVAIEAADSAAGLRVLQSDVRIDLLVTDVGLPGGMNGRQMADAARERRPDLKVLFITGYAENALVGNGHLEPGMQVLTKPFAMEALAARIRDFISRA